MKLLVVADIHGNPTGLQTTVEKITTINPDGVIVCGDITNYSRPPGWGRTFFRMIREYMSENVFMVPGNCDYISLINEIDNLAVSLHNRTVHFEKLTFVGFGGSNPTPFKSAFSLSEDKIYVSLKSIFDNLQHHRNILVVHTPPKGYLDKTFIGYHVGSTAITKIVDEYIPELVLSAHVHEARGVIHTDKTTFVNPGPAFKGYGALVEIDDKIEVDLLD